MKIKTLTAACAGALAAWAAASALAQEIADTVVVTATRVERPTFDLPLSIDSVGGTRIQEQQAGVNISESLNRVPGTVVQNRETYAQEQQITIRGFGARSQFGVRGIKLLADGIPASTPDGQGGSGLFDLSSAKRIEVLRGPFSALYGNHSGGVVQVFTEDGPPDPTLTGSFAAGSYDTWRAGVKFGGQSGALNYIGSASRFETDGYRDWSEARKDQVNAKLRYTPDAKSSWTFVANYLDQPDNLDPLGLTAAELAQNRRQASPAALQFQTRRSLDNLQGGLVYESAVTDMDTLRAMVYAGNRSNEQYLAIPTATQNGLTHAGGLSAFERDFYGVGLRWTRKFAALTLTAGADYERAEDARKGYLNNLGVRGSLKRDEVNTVWQAGGYAQAEWQLAADWSLSAGLRYTKVSFDSKDNFICTTTLVTAPGTTAGRCSGSTTLITATARNPDDSGSASYDAWTPAVGLLYRLSQSVNLYANAGRSFETPTFIELAYKPDGTSGLNFALQPSKSNHYEIGMKAFLGTNARLNVALFQIDTSNEIVTATNAGGRTTFQNAGDTQRRGIEVALDGNFGGGLSGYLSATYLEAKFKDSFRVCTGIPCTTPNATVNADNRIPGVPNYTVYGELAWRYAPLGFSTALEGRWNGKVLVNDINTVSTDSYFVANLRAGFEQKIGNWRFTEFARVDNLFDEDYIGAVYVNDANSRFFAPAPERNYLVGVTAGYTFR
jgi:iron complex outermembrane receptor protein